MRAAWIVILVLLLLAPPPAGGASHDDYTASGEIIYDGTETGKVVVIMATIMECGCVGDLSPFIGPVEEWLNISDDFRYVEFGQRGTQNIFEHREAADIFFGNGDGQVDVGEAARIWDGLVNVGQFRGWGQGQYEITNPTRKRRSARAHTLLAATHRDRRLLLRTPGRIVEHLAAEAR